LQSKDFVQNVQHMIQVSVHTSVISSQLAALYMKEGGLLLLPGAAGALSATPDAIGYGLAKAAVHHLIKSLSKAESGLPKNSIVCGIAPTILDTEANRHAMPNADTSKWIKLDALGQKIVEWCSDKKPTNGALYKIESENGVLICEEVKNL
jgi:dihydropteridine reductase